MRLNKIIKNEIVINYLNGKDVGTLASKYNQSVKYINGIIKNYKKPIYKKIFLLDEENISFNLFSKVVSLSENDMVYVFSNKLINFENPNLVKISAPISKFKDSLDYRLIVGIGEIKSLHQKDFSNNLAELIIVSNDNIFSKVINSIEFNISVLKITPDSVINGAYTLNQVFKSVLIKDVEEPKVADTPLANTPLKKATLKLAKPKKASSVNIKNNSELLNLLKPLNKDSSAKIITLFEKDVLAKSLKLSSNIHNLLRSETNEADTLFSSLAKLFKTLKKSTS